MKTLVATAALLLAAAGLASAQDDRERLEELKRDFERQMKSLQQKYDAQRAEMEKMFKAQMERLLEKKGPAPKEGERRPEEKKPRSTDELLQRILERLDRLEKRLDQDLPRFDFKRSLPFENLPRDFKDLPKFGEQFERRFGRDFDFRDFKEFAPYWREFLPKFKDEQFRFEFKKKGGDDDDGEKKEEKKDKKGRKEKNEDDKKKY